MGVDYFRLEYERLGRPYGTSQQGFDRWCDERIDTLEDEFFGRQSRDPRRIPPDDRQAAPASANARTQPQ